MTGHEPVSAHDFRYAIDDETQTVLDVEAAGTVLDDLTAALQAQVRREPVVLKVPGRAGLALRFHPDIEFELYRAWVRKATGRKDDDPDFLKLALTVLAHTSAGVLLHGLERTVDGEPLRLSSPQVHTMLGVPAGSTAAAIRKLYGSDGHIIQTMKLIVEAAGYALDGDVEELRDGDPLAS